MHVAAFLMAALAAAAPIAYGPPPTYAITPKMKSATYVANVTDPALTRDSCGSSRIGNRVLWTCRDTALFNQETDQAQMLPIMVNSAAWTNLTTAGGPDLRPGPAGAGSNGSNPILQMYGGHPAFLPAYFPIQDAQCPQSGACSDGTRWVVWPDQPPLITSQTADGSGTGYNWISNSHIRDHFVSIDPVPSHSLYKSVYTASSSDLNALPDVTVISSQFYKSGEIGFGSYGNIIVNDTAYLYGQTASKKTVLAKVPVNMIEFRGEYTYYSPTSNSWSRSPPSFSTTSPQWILPNAGAGGQGTFYYSTYFSSYVWLGQSSGLDGAFPSFYISTAPKPEGPWTKPFVVFQGETGDHPMSGGYTLQAHPSLLPSGPGVASENGIYLSWTQQFLPTTCSSGYVTPLVWLEFE